MSLKKLYLLVFALLWGMATLTAAWSQVATAQAIQPAEEKEQTVLKPLELAQPAANWQFQLRPAQDVLVSLPASWHIPVLQFADYYNQAEGIIRLGETLFTCILPAQAP